MGKKKNPGLLFSLLGLIAVVQIAPLLVTFLNSFRTDREIKKWAVGFPTRFSLENYAEAWQVGGYAEAFVNSIIVSAAVTAVILFCAVTTGYFLAAFDIRIKGPLLVYYGVALSIPVFSYLIPVYYLFANLNLVNTRAGIVLIYIAINLPFNILLARTFIAGIPKELGEAATIDGCSTFQVIAKIIYPLSKPIVTTITLIIFVATWNEFTLANTFLQTPSIKTVATRYVFFVGERGSDLALIYTAAVIAMLPIIAAFAVLQNRFIDGMTSGSIK